MMYQLDKKPSPDEQIRDILCRHIAKYGPPPPVTVEVHPSVAAQLTPCQDMVLEQFDHVQPCLALMEVKEKEEI